MMSLNDTDPESMGPYTRNEDFNLPVRALCTQQETVHAEPQRHKLTPTASWVDWMGQPTAMNEKKQFVVNLLHRIGV